MNSKSLLIAALLAVALVALGLFMADSKGSEAAEASSAGEHLLPGLYDSLDNVSQVSVQSTDGGFNVELSDNQWTLSERDGYPVQVDMVRKAIIALAELKTLEQKTDDPGRYSQLGVQAVGADPTAEAQSKQITLMDESGNTLAALIIGKPRSGGRGGTFYARQPAETASWLVEGEMPNLPGSGDDWLDKKILEINRTDVGAVRITHGDGEVLTISKKDAETNYTVHELPEDRELSYDGVAGGIAGALQYLNFLDVMRAENFESTEAQASVTNFWTKDGLRITAQLWEKDEKVYGSFQAAYDPEGAPAIAELGPTPPPAEGEDDPASESEATPRPREEVEAEVVALNARVGPWIYELPPYAQGSLAKRLDSMLKPLPEPEEIESAEEEDEQSPISIDSFGGPVENNDDE